MFQSSKSNNSLAISGAREPIHPAKVDARIFGSDSRSIETIFCDASDQPGSLADGKRKAQAAQFSRGGDGSANSPRFAFQRDDG